MYLAHGESFSPFEQLQLQKMMSKSSAILLVYLLYLMGEASSLLEIDVTYPLLCGIFGGGKKIE